MSYPPDDRWPWWACFAVALAINTLGWAVIITGALWLYAWWRG
ncbi:MAG TPA: hypothetical protein VEL07_19355 [Planctomycetota bacterium]|nr:hypothetical protein [Planctomycetota bacterium]